jgi:hypothetical protein
MAGPDTSEPRNLVDKLSDAISSSLSHLATLVKQLGEVAVIFVERFADNISVITGQASETVITGLAVSVAYDVLQDVLRKQWVGTPEEQEDFRQRAQRASDHLAQAAEILDGLQTELRDRNQELEGVLSEIEVRQADAERWRQIASINEHLASALTEEIEKRMRTQVRAELDRGRTRRRSLAAVSWFFTLILGGVVGAMIQQWWKTGQIFP